MATSYDNSEEPNMAIFALETTPDKVKNIPLNRVSPRTLKKVFKLNFLPEVLTDPHGTSIVHEGEEGDADGWSPRLGANIHYLVDVQSDMRGQYIGQPYQGQPIIRQPVHGQSQPYQYQPSTPMLAHAQPGSYGSAVLQQPGISRQLETGELMRDWNSGVFNCMDDPLTCLWAYFCPCILLCDLSKQMGEGCCFGCLCPGALTGMRIKLRMEENIQGTLIDDYLMTNCCHACTMCQLARELKTLGRGNSSLHI